MITEKEMQAKVEWLKQRKKTIGGSDAAAIVGLNPYRSALSVWQDKVSEVIEIKEPSEAVRQGIDLEEYVAQRFCEATGKRVIKCDKTLYNSKYPFAHANVDRLIVGENALLECKTTSQMNLKRYRNGEYPTEYYVQCMHYLAVTGYDKAYLAVLVFSKGFYIFEIERDEAEIEALMQTEEVFMRDYVQTGIMPNADDYPIYLSEVDTFYPFSKEEEIELLDKSDIIDEIVAKKEVVKNFEKDIEALETKIKLAMGENAVANIGSYKVTWRTSERKVFNYKEFIKDNPNLNYDNYYKVSSSRRFLINKIKEKGEK